MFRKITRYTQDVVEELRRCTWPSAAEVGNSTVLVLVVGVVLALIIMGADQVFRKLIYAI